MRSQSVDIINSLAWLAHLIAWRSEVPISDPASRLLYSSLKGAFWLEKPTER